MKTSTLRLKVFLTVPLFLAFTSPGAASSLAQVSPLTRVTSIQAQVSPINPSPSVLDDPTPGGILPLESNTVDTTVPGS
jgi:hypothetical protein